MRRTKAVQGVAAAAAPFFALARPSSLHALTRSLQAFSTLAAAFAASLAGSTFGGAFGIAHTHARRLAEGRARCRSAHTPRLAGFRQLGGGRKDAGQICACKNHPDTTHSSSYLLLHSSSSLAMAVEHSAGQ